MNTAESNALADMVLTPGGLRSSSLVHKIEAGTVLDGSTGSIRNLDADGNVLADFGVIAAKPEGAPLMPLNVSHPARPAPAFGSGWITYASWANSSGSPVSSFSTQWIVPPPPIAEDEQVIFLFNGIQNSTMIYQPVLQWGYQLREEETTGLWPAGTPTVREGRCSTLTLPGSIPAIS